MSLITSTLSLKNIMHSAEKTGKKVSICGELGGAPMATMLLLGLGKIDALSMEPHSIPKVKKIIRTIRIQEAQKLADDVLKMSCPNEISTFIINEMRARFPEDFDRSLSFEKKINPTSS